MFKCRIMCCKDTFCSSGKQEQTKNQRVFKMHDQSGRGTKFCISNLKTRFLKVHFLKHIMIPINAEPTSQLLKWCIMGSFCLQNVLIEKWFHCCCRSRLVSQGAAIHILQDSQKLAIVVHLRTCKINSTLKMSFMTKVY